MKYLIRISEGHDTNFAIDSMIVPVEDAKTLAAVVKEYDDEYYTVRISIFKD